MPFWSKSSAESVASDAPRHLPLPTGPHAVGYADVMTPGDETDGVFLRLYYPSALPLTETINQHHLWPLWAEDEYILGFVKFMQAMLAKWPSWAPRGEFLYIDQISHIAPVMHLGCTYVWKLLNGKVYCPILKNAPISTEKKWPVIIFSHGMGCSRFAYSRICTDLASHGFLVGAVEHRDGSACLSFSMGEAGERKLIPHLRVTEADNEYLVRHTQLLQRAQEAARALDLVTSLAKGETVANVLTNKQDFDLSMFTERLELSSPVMAGHSFGGATTLLALHQEQRFKQGLVLDGWLFPLRDYQLSPSQPIVFINTESFASRLNIERTKSFLKGSGTAKRRMVFIKGSVHQNHIDAPLIFKPGRIKKILGMQSDTEPGLVLDINNKLMLHFIWSNLHEEVDTDIVQFLEHHDEIIIEATDEDQVDEALDNSKFDVGEVSQDSGICDEI